MNVKAQLVPLALLVTIGLDGLILLGKFDGGVAPAGRECHLPVTRTPCDSRPQQDLIALTSRRS